MGYCLHLVDKPPLTVELSCKKVEFLRNSMSMFLELQFNRLNGQKTGNFLLRKWQKLGNMSLQARLLIRSSRLVNMAVRLFKYGSCLPRLLP